jgi:phage shock protein C
MMNGKPLRRTRKNRVIVGVLGAFSDFFQINSFRLRLVCLIVWIFSGIIPGLIAYLVLVFLIPSDSQ